MFNAEANKKAVPVRALYLPLAMTDSEKNYLSFIVNTVPAKEWIAQKQSFDTIDLYSKKMPFCSFIIATVADDLNL